jgi:hypothetical protein
MISESAKVPVMARHKLTASDFIGLGGAHNIADGKQRLRERDARAELDTRTPAQVLLGEPPPGRSALATMSKQNTGRTVRSMNVSGCKRLI